MKSAHLQAKVYAASLIVPSLAFAQFTPSGAGHAPATGGGTTISVIQHAKCASANTNDVTCSLGDTTGANGILCAVATLADATTGTLTDTKSNTYTALTNSGAASDSNGAWWYAKNATAGASHSATYTLNGSFPAMICYATSNIDTSAPADQQAGVYPGSSSSHATVPDVTPTENSEIVVSLISNGGGTSWAATGLTVLEAQDFVGSVNLGITVGHVIQTTAGAQGADWTAGGGFSVLGLAGRSATFKLIAAALSWASLTNGQWTALTNGQWTGMTN